MIEEELINYLYKPFEEEDFANFKANYPNKMLVEDEEKVWFTDYPIADHSKGEYYIERFDDNNQAINVGIGTNNNFYGSQSMTIEIIEQAYNGAWYKKGYAPIKPAPTKEEQSANREREYTQYVDPITSHITRLKDEEQSPAVVAEIEELKLERTAKIEEIKAKYPYPVEV